MGELKPREWYDDALTQYPYTAPVEANPFEPLWRAVAADVPRGFTIVDLGCGPGHVASLVAPRARSYVGVDWSPAAVDVARRATRFAPAVIVCADLTRFAPPPAEIYLAVEFLEHVEDDLAILRRIPPLRTLIASLPKRDSEGHVRWFETAESVIDRYNDLFIVVDVRDLGDWWLLKGVRR